MIAWTRFGRPGNSVIALSWCQHEGGRDWRLESPCAQGLLRTPSSPHTPLLRTWKLFVGHQLHLSLLLSSSSTA
jgi:hypothetical protein